MRPPCCGEDHMVGERPDDCFACLSEQRDALLSALRARGVLSDWQTFYAVLDNLGFVQAWFVYDAQAQLYALEGEGWSVKAVQGWRPEASGATK